MKRCRKFCRESTTKKPDHHPKKRISEMSKKKRIEEEPQEHNHKPRWDFQARSEKQKLAWDAINENTITFLVGPAGTGKTYVPTAYAANALIEGQVNSIVITRPTIEAGEKLGYLPGEFSDKVKPFLMPILDAADKIMGPGSNTRIEVEKKTRIEPLAYMRGRTFSSSIILLDEAQNVTVSQMRMFLSRLGDGSKIIVNGDSTQSDIRDCRLMDFVDSLSKINGIGVVKFDDGDIVRHPLISKVLEATEHIK